MLTFHKPKDDTRYFALLHPADEHPLVRAETESPYVIGYRLIDSVCDWLDEHAPGWDEHDASGFNGPPSVYLILARPEHCVEFQIRWG